MTESAHEQDKSGSEAALGRVACSVTKRDGTPCRSFVGPNGTTCTAHDPDPEAQARMQEQRSRAGKNKPKGRLNEALQAKAEEHAEEIARVYLEGMRATKYLFPGEGAPPIEVPDHEMRRKSVDSWLDRALGKPKQQTELSFDRAQFLEMIAPASPAASIDPASHLRLAPAPAPMPQPFVIDVEPEPEDDRGDEDAA